MWSQKKDNRGRSPRMPGTLKETGVVNTESRYQKQQTGTGRIKGRTQGNMITTMEAGRAARRTRERIRDNIERDQEY